VCVCVCVCVRVCVCALHDNGGCPLYVRLEASVSFLKPCARCLTLLDHLTLLERCLIIQHCLIAFYISTVQLLLLSFPFCALCRLQIPATFFLAASPPVQI